MKELNKLKIVVFNIFSSFFFSFLLGNVWIYSIYKPNYVKNTTSLESYCNKTLYLYAFWSTTLIYILVAVLLTGGCFVLFLMFLCGHPDPDDDV